MTIDVNHLLVEESGRIGPDIHNKTLHINAWTNLIKQEEWPDEMGTDISVMTYERSLPANSLTWNTVGFNTGTGSNCVPAAEVVNFAQTLRTYNLKQTAIESPKICVNDLRFTMKRKEQLGQCFRILTENTQWAWQERFRDEYIRIAEHKMIVKDGLPEGTASFPLAQPTSKLVQEVLNRVYMSLVRDGAAINNAMGRENGRPIFTLVCGPETSDQLIRDSGEIQTDYRYSSQVDELLKPLGVERSYRGFYHVIDDLPPRYDFVGGVWTRRMPYVGVAATKGTKYDINPQYEAAQYEMSIVLIPEVYCSLVPRPISSPGGNTTFEPQKYRGDWNWLNIQDRVENPDKTIGYFRGVLSNGSKPIRPEWGYCIMHQRCENQLGLVSCS